MSRYTSRRYTGRRTITCACGCARTGPAEGRGLIHPCYQRARATGTLHRWPARQPPAAVYQARQPRTLDRIADYADLLAWGHTPAQAAARLGVSLRTARRYQAHLRTTNTEQKEAA